MHRIGDGQAAMTADRDRPEILSRAATEARQIAQGLGRIDAALGTLLHATGIEAATPLQSADLLRQEVEGLASFLSALADQAAQGRALDGVAAADGLPLAAQARRLTGLPDAQCAGLDDLWGGAA